MLMPTEALVTATFTGAELLLLLKGSSIRNCLGLKTAGWTAGNSAHKSRTPKSHSLRDGAAELGRVGNEPCAKEDDMQKCHQGVWAVLALFMKWPPPSASLLQSLVGPTSALCLEIVVLCSPTHWSVQMLW